MKKFSMVLLLSTLNLFVAIPAWAEDRSSASPTADASVAELKEESSAASSIGLPFPKNAPVQATAYLRMHTLAAQTTNPDWEQSMNELSRQGDGGSLGFLKALKAPDLTAAQAKVVERTIQAIKKRLVSDESMVPVGTFVERLERAALADVVCHRMESTLVSWAKKTVQTQMGRSELRMALERMANENDKPTNTSGLDATYRQRLATYARGLLKP
ncbi:MAG: hypothetical protein JNN07_15320 [Verrucomicrobiales bacterium]|nr:hypothetical protein [Verrucomicrobiales bacterium]